MKELTLKSLNLFNQLHPETQEKFLLALEFSVQSQESTLKQIQLKHPELKVELEPAFNEERITAVN